MEWDRPDRASFNAMMPCFRLVFGWGWQGRSHLRGLKPGIDLGKQGRMIRFQAENIVGMSLLNLRCDGFLTLVWIKWFQCCPIG